MMDIALTFVALLIELMIGYPDRLVHLIGHPVTWIGSMIDLLDRTLNRESMSDTARQMAGILGILAVIGVVAAMAYLLQHNRLPWPLGPAIAAVMASTLIAQRSLYRHVADVAEALDRDGIMAGRKAVSRIVGRDPEALDEAGVARAAIESLAENFSDGVVAPVFWLLVGGLVTGSVYKAINTADSMIGHRTRRHASFGWAAARLDDIVNLPASRLSALLIVAAAGIASDTSAAGAWRAVWRDASRHRSPNAGYPEAAMAGALGLKLAGPRLYGGVLVEDATMGSGRRQATAGDIRAALILYRRADAILIAAISMCLLLVILAN